MTGKLPREIRLTNTLSGKKEVLQTLVPGKLTMYSCGPTVWGQIHIGNLRTALASDLFFRYLKRVGYDVTFVRNYTDVDDKIINQGKKEGITAEAVAKKYTVEVEKDYALSGMREPSHKTTVTGHMKEIIAMIGQIIATERAYVVSDGEVLFAIEKFPGYGKLSGKAIDDLVAGIRVEVSSKKKNPLDFTLWKPAKPGEPSWDSPWGKGRPGWHIECSAMASKWLGPKIDLHHGGEDLVFPHHENEIAQSESASGQAPFARYWVHSAHLNMGATKMSKSLGNVMLARDFLAQYGGEVTRYLFLSAHYHSKMEFTQEAIDGALTQLSRIYEAKAKAKALASESKAMPDMRAESLWGSFAVDCEKTHSEIDDAYANDFNTPGALGALFTLIREFNRLMAEPLAKATPAAILGAQELLRLIEDDIGDVIGIGRLEPAKFMADLEGIRVGRLAASGVAKPSDLEIQALIQERLDARKTKNFARADEIRKELDVRGVVLKDGPGGTAWEYK